MPVKSMITENGARTFSFFWEGIYWLKVRNFKNASSTELDSNEREFILCKNRRCATKKRNKHKKEQWCNKHFAFFVGARKYTFNCSSYL